MAAGKRRIRPADDLLLGATRRTIAELTLSPEDTAAATLAEHYARQIDDADPASAQETLALLGPKLLACLVELGATPRTRALARRGVAPGGPGKLAQLREARRAN